MYLSVFLSSCICLSFFRYIFVCLSFGMYVSVFLSSCILNACQKKDRQIHAERQGNT
jgi:hypothetical protein